MIFVKWDVDRVVINWRISEYELVDDNEASHVDIPAVLYSGSLYLDGCTDEKPPDKRPLKMPTPD